MMVVELAALLGLVIWLVFPTAKIPNAKISEAGRIVFSWAVLALMLKWSGFRF